MARVTMLDCTLRDGGYYNSWDFDLQTARNYIRACARAAIDVVEIGFRFTPKKQFLGPFAYATDNFLRDVWDVKGPKLAVMVNASDIIQFPGGTSQAMDILFRSRLVSPVEIVRIAAHFREIEACEAITKKLKELGYTVVMNLMQSGGRPTTEITDAAKKINAWKTVDVLYFADSLGSMAPADVTSIVDALRKGWEGPLGIHTHDNCQRAVSNTMAAFEAGATWLDSTMLGMGRGAGNARTEYLLSELHNRGVGNYVPSELFPLVLEDFQKLWETHRWGSNLVYYLSAQYGVHPTYSQQMLEDGRYDSQQILEGLEFLRASGASGSFSQSNLRRALAGQLVGSQGSWDATAWAKGRDVLLVAAGESVARHRDGLMSYIDHNCPIVLSLNINHALPPRMISAYIACHRTRLMIEAQEYRRMSHTLIAPLAVFPEGLRAEFEDIKILDYGVEIADGRLEISKTGCVLPAALAAPYSLAVATAAGAKRILLAGFDGYSAGDPRQSEMTGILETYQKLPGSVPVIALTPTSYPVQQSSLFAPHI